MRDSANEKLPKRRKGQNHAGGGSPLPRRDRAHGAGRGADEGRRRQGAGSPAGPQRARAAEERISARLEKPADTVALWLEDADAATTDIKDYTARKRELESAMNKPEEEGGTKNKK